MIAFFHSYIMIKIISDIVSILVICEVGLCLVLMPNFKIFKRSVVYYDDDFEERLQCLNPSLVSNVKSV